MKDIPILFEEEGETSTAKELLEELIETFKNKGIDEPTDLMLVLFKTSDGRLLLNFAGNEVRDNEELWKLLGILEWAKSVLNGVLISGEQEEGDDDNEDD